MIHLVAVERTENIENLSRAFTEDRNWLAFMKVFLDVGNILNLGTRRGGALGFKFSSFKSYVTCKGNNGKTYLLPYIMNKIFDQKPETLEFFPDLYLNLKTATFNLDDVLTDLAKIKGRFNSLKSLLESADKLKPKDENFIAQYTPFFQENVNKIIELETRCKDAKTQFLQVAVKLGDDPKKISSMPTNDIIIEYKKVFDEFQKPLEALLKEQEKARKKGGEKKEKKTKKSKVQEEDD